MGKNNKSKILQLEILNVLRNKRFILLALILPLIIYPLLMFGFIKIDQNEVQVLDEVTIGFSIEPTEELKEAIQDSEIKYKINIDDKVTSYVKALKEEKINAYFHISNKEDGLIYTIYTNPNIDKNMEVVNQLELAINNYNNSIISEKLVPEGNELQLAMYNFIEVEIQPTTLMEILRNTIKEPIVVSLPYLLILNMMIVGLCVAAMSRLKNDNIGQTEILISSGLNTKDLINNKYWVVLLSTIVNGIVGALSIGISGTIIYMINKTHIQELFIKLRITIKLLHIMIVAIYVVIAIVAIAMTITAICVYISSVSNRYSKLISTIILLAGAWVLWKQIYFFVHIVMNNKVFEEFIYGYQMQWGVETCSYGFVITYIVMRLCNREKAIFGIDKNVSPIKAWRNKERGGLPTLGEALLVYCITYLIPITVYELLGIVMNMQMSCGISVAIIIVYFKRDIKNTLSLRLPKCRYIIGAVLIYIATYIIRIMLNDQMQILLPTTIIPQIGIINMYKGEMSEWVILLITAVSPAIFEELLMRGVLFSGLSNTDRGEVRKKTVIFAILVSSLLFAIPHGEIRLLPGMTVAAIGYSYIVYKTGSIYLPMLLHFFNNFTSFIKMRYTYSDFSTFITRFYIDVISGEKEIAILIVVACTILAAILFRKTKKERQRDNTEVSRLDVV